MTWSSHGITLECAEGVATLSLASGDTGNVLGLERSKALRDGVRKARQLPDVGCLLLRAEGPRFCVGGDLREFLAARMGARLNEEVAVALHEAIAALSALPAPVVAAVQGAVGGGGVGLVLAADIIVAASSARFVSGYTASGLSPDCGVSWELPQRLGTARAMDLILTNRPVGAEEAAALGVISRVVDDTMLAAETRALARSLADGPRQALAEAKRLIRLAADRPKSAHLDDEARTIGDMGDTTDAREGIAAFLAKRPPAFSAGASARLAGHSA
jgi:2-(1,2-epoxy-1,2-dihydrophenyl)acetyl-CoA isomerase